MENNISFVDYYGVLQVNPNCDARTLELAYRHLAKIYHPDHAETEDIEEFKRIIEAYRLLKDNDKRLNYNVRYAQKTGYLFESSEGNQTEQMDAITDAKIHQKILLYLYKKRRERAQDPSAGLFDILRNINCPEENFEFHIWYLRKKDFIETNDNGLLAITVVGVDHVIAMSQNAVEQRLRITHSDSSDMEQWFEPDQGNRSEPSPYE